jgi:hypothetical protein
MKSIKILDINVNFLERTEFNYVLLMGTDGLWNAFSL